jgi:hypothetical protein
MRWAGYSDFSFQLLSLRVMIPYLVLQGRAHSGSKVYGSTVLPLVKRGTTTATRLPIDKANDDSESMNGR